MESYKYYLVRAGVAFSGLGLPLAAQAAENPFSRGLRDVTNVGTEAGIGGTRSLSQIVGGLINVALGFLGIVLLAYILFAGFQWMTAGGDKEAVGKAQTNIRNAIIGLIIIVAAFAISNFVMSSLISVTTGGPTPGI